MKTKTTKEAPYSKESEMLVLGCMLTCTKSFRTGSRLLEEDDFHLKEHKFVLSAFKALFNEEKSADIHLLSATLKSGNKLASAGGVAYLTTLAQYAGTSTHIEEYIESLKEYTTRRRLIELSKQSGSLALEKTSLRKTIEEIHTSLRSIERKRSIKSRFQIQFLDQFEDNFLLAPPPKKPMLLECFQDDDRTITGFLPKGIVAMLVGAGGVGKTTLLSQLALSVASGTPFLGIFTPTSFCGPEKKGGVFIGLGENQYDDIHRILYKASKALHKESSSLFEDLLFEASKRIAPYSFCGQQSAFIEDGKTSAYFKELKIKLEDTAPSEGWSLLIFDPISRIMGTDAEADNAVATQFVSLMEELALDLPGNPTVLLSHHVNKSALNQSNAQNQSAARGSSALTDGVRWQCNYSKEQEKILGPENSEDLFLLKMTKSNFTAIFPDIKTKKDPEGFIELVTESQSAAFFS